MDEDDLDLDAFIANIEQSAPKEELDSKDGHKCQECNFILEEDDDGAFICPNCSAQATNILRLEATECYQDETGRNIVGQVVKLNKKSKHDIDYGWAWSTDEAIIHLLTIQINVLEKIGLVSENTFRQGITNMWFKFWAQNIAPFIKDKYNDGDLIPLEAMKALKFRDIEVLVKVRDKVMIPEKQIIKKRSELRQYEMLNVKFTKQNPKINLLSSASSKRSSPLTPSSDTKGDIATASDDDDVVVDDNVSVTTSTCLDARYGPKELPEPCKTQNIGKDSIAILTLNRTLAFIEATSRCLGEPVFASDIIRACNQRLIPFFGAHKSLPEGMNLNYTDMPMFRKIRPPSPLQLTASASLLLHKIYKDDFPVYIPVPSFDKILQRFMIDLNLPKDLINNFNKTINFSCFKQTRPTKFNRVSKITQLPQYDRWAFVILLCHLKKLFGLDDKSIAEQKEAAKCYKDKTGKKSFIFIDWIKQLSIRLQLIMSYDPYILFHPMTNTKKLQPNPQLFKYIETVLDDKVTATTRLESAPLKYDDLYRTELSDFFARHIPKPPLLDDRITNEDLLDKPTNFNFPIQDALHRTKRFWLPDVSKNSKIDHLVFKDFLNKNVVLANSVDTWSIYDGRGCPSNLKFELIPEWPYSFKLLLSVGGYLCYCEPRELLREFRFVEEYLYPELVVVRRRSRKNTTRETIDNTII